ncbi:MAG: patatin-like phospholipase family protein [Anaerolineae bacterium]
MEKSFGRKRIGLALSGAVARGFTHLGVLIALERSGIPIDVITGTSAGAMVGALYAAGITTAEMQNQIGHLSWLKIAGLVWPREGFVSFARMERWLTQIIGDVTFAQLKMPFAAVATDLQRGEPFTLREGSVARAVHASSAVPGFVVPVRMYGRILCDGGVSANIPIAAARELGADYVIGVDLFAHHIRKGWGPLRYGFAAIEALVRNSGDGRARADYVITPELAGSYYLRMSNYRERIQLGINSTEAALPAIRAALAGLDAGPVMPLLSAPLDRPELVAP